MIEPEQVAVPEVPEMEGNRMADMLENAESGNERNGNAEMTNGPGSPESHIRAPQYYSHQHCQGIDIVLQSVNFGNIKVLADAELHKDIFVGVEGIEAGLESVQRSGGMGLELSVINEVNQLLDDGLKQGLSCQLKALRTGGAERATGPPIPQGSTVQQAFSDFS
ncbi:hypothetical protein DFH07DRAFT_763600 [Mycena maculata]|uniref:Uncharacterized protein n=1 Tax=Mycena maculata TaxID=230809 RepID=A0AAD7KHT8_9AGAR|nr:hypothetical protein DFH07DRAFT_763600 [Mycena maculata]